MKLIMENWRKFKKINESMEEVWDITAKYPDMEESDMQTVISLVRDYLATVWQPQATAEDEEEAFKAIDDPDQRAFALDLLQLNKEKFGHQADQFFSTTKADPGVARPRSGVPGPEKASAAAPDYKYREV